MIDLNTLILAVLSTTADKNQRALSTREIRQLVGLELPRKHYNSMLYTLLNQRKVKKEDVGPAPLWRLAL